MYCGHVKYLHSKNVKLKIYKTIVFCGCETWFLTLREERRVRAFENRALTKIFQTKSHEVIEGWSKLHSEDSHNFFDRLCGLVVSVPGYRSIDPGFDSRRYQIFWEIVGLKWGPLSLVNITENLLEWKSSRSGSRKSRLMAVRILCADHATFSIVKSWH
jgi:hypothetical protein